MPAKSKKPVAFAVGDRAIVVDKRDGRIIDSGVVSKTSELALTFQSDELGERRGFIFHRKGTLWVELNVDHAELRRP